MILLNPQWFILAYANETRTWAIFTLELQTFLQMIPNLLSFILLAFMFKRFLYAPVRNILQKRADRVEADMLSAAEDKATAEELRATYEQKVRDIELERNEILEAARKEAAIRVAQILGDAKEDAQITRDRARRDIAAEQERVKAEMHQAIVDISTDMAAKLVAATIDKQAHDRLFAEAMDELESTAFRAF